MSNPHSNNGFKLLSLTALSALKYFEEILTKSLVKCSVNNWIECGGNVAQIGEIVQELTQMGILVSFINDQNKVHQAKWKPGNNERNEHYSENFQRFQLAPHILR